MVRLVQKLGFKAGYQTQNSPCGLRALTIIVFVTESTETKYEVRSIVPFGRCRSVGNQHRT